MKGPPPQILDDILRLSSQILNPAETELWSSICERDLRKVTKNKYLSGIRKIASDIKNEIADFPKRKYSLIKSKTLKISQK